MRIPEGLIEGTLLSRITRFSVLVNIKNREVIAYLPNSGRLKELLRKGNRVLLLSRKSPNRKTGYDLLFVYNNKTLVSVDARLPNILFHEAVKNRALKEFESYRVIKREVEYKGGRIDFLLGNRKDCFVEVKSVTLVKDGIGLFPDVPTLRGKKHLKDLIEIHRKGYPSAIVFIIQREDVKGFAPNREIDPEFASTLKEAVEEGVWLYAYRCKLNRKEIKIGDRVDELNL